MAEGRGRGERTAQQTGGYCTVDEAEAFHKDRDRQLNIARTSLAYWRRKGTKEFWLRKLAESPVNGPDVSPLFLHLGGPCVPVES